MLNGRSRLSRQKRNDYKWAYIMIAPTVIGLFVLDVWPIIQSFILSLNKDLGFGKTRFVGMENYKRLLADNQVWQASFNTLYYTLLVVPIGIFLSLLVAVALNSKIKGRGFFRTIYFLPMVVTPAAVALAWKWIFNAEFGVLNAILAGLGVGPVAWLTSQGMIIPSLAIVTIWSEIGYNAIILLAGLQGIEPSYYEAADIDGAKPVRKFFKITLPLISPTLFFVIITRMIFTLKQFDFAWMMISDVNPAREYGQTIMYYYYRTAFVNSNQSYASAIVMFTLVFILLFTALQFLFEKKWVNYDA